MLQPDCGLVQGEPAVTRVRFDVHKTVPFGTPQAQRLRGAEGDPLFNVQPSSAGGVVRLQGV